MAHSGKINDIKKTLELIDERFLLPLLSQTLQKRTSS
jgi:hypothetical protein